MGGPQSFRHLGQQSSARFNMWLPGLPGELYPMEAERKRAWRWYTSFLSTTAWKRWGYPSIYTPLATTSHVAPFQGKGAGKCSPLLGSCFQQQLYTMEENTNVWRTVGHLHHSYSIKMSLVKLTFIWLEFLKGISVTPCLSEILGGQSLSLSFWFSWCDSHMLVRARSAISPIWWYLLHLTRGPGYSFCSWCTSCHLATRIFHRHSPISL